MVGAEILLPARAGKSSSKLNVRERHRHAIAHFRGIGRTIGAPPQPPAAIRPHRHQRQAAAPLTSTRLCQ
jgi:hypothetical protein